jgi:twitching motility protein PilT
MDFDALLKLSVKQKASDIHLQSGSPPMLRISGLMRAVQAPPLTDERLRGYIRRIVPAHIGEQIDQEIFEGLDFSHVLDGQARFRCSAHGHMGSVGMVMRLIHTEIPPFESLNLPKVLADVVEVPRGIVLLTGTTGSGKSTTLASLIDLINRSRQAKIITIEDPVEFVHTNDKALISQLEVGRDTPSFDQALRQALRQDPDMILVGELRDVETLRIALRAADTGHLVFSTVHSSNAPQTIERVIAMFPPAEHHLLLSQLAGSVEAIVSQRLLSLRDGTRRPAVEILRGGPVTEKLILEGDIPGLRDFLEQADMGMQSFDQHLLQMYHDELISGTEAMRWATNAEALSMRLRGIKNR